MATTYTQLKAGDRIGKCEIVRLLGKGGMGAVYLAKHTTLDILVAVKTLAPDSISEDKRESNRFIREAKLAAQIRHPNVVAIMDADMDEENGLYYIVMEYVDGGNLAEYLQGEPLDPEWVFSVVYQVGEALQEASRFGIVHRDIKPHNIMVNDQGVAKLADLGLAKSVGHDSVSLTVMGSALGTPAYMSPQQAADAKNADGRDDIYSLGATLYECLTGKPPFDGDSVYSVITKVVTKTPDDPRFSVPNAPPTLIALCGKMMARERDRRYANADELMADLNTIRNEGLESVENMSASGFLAWPGSTYGVDPNAPTEVLDPEAMRAAAQRGMAAAPTAPELTQEVVVPKAQEHVVASQAHAAPLTEELSAHTVPGKAPVKTKWPLIGAGVVLLAVLIGGALVWTNLSAPTPVPAAPAPAAPVAATATPAPAAPRYGQVYIETIPAGATVTLDGKDPQTTPATFRQVPVGAHNLQIEMEGFETLFERYTVEEGEVARRSSPIRLVAKQGTMVITTQPTDATITLPSGKRAQSPATFKNMPVGTYELVVSKAGFTTMTVPVTVLQDDVVTPPRIKLVAETGSINVTSEPPGAEILIDGEEDKAPSVTPATVPQLSVGKRRVQLKLAGYQIKDIEVEIKPGATTRVPLVKLIAAAGSVKIEPNMAGSSYELYETGDQALLKAGKAPATVADLAPGTYRLVLTHPSDIPNLPLRAEMQFEIEPGQELVAKPKILFGAVSFQATPSKTMVFINSQPTKFAPYSLTRVPVGELEVRFGQPGYGEVTKSGIVKAGSTLRLEASLKRTKDDTSRGRNTFPGPPGPRPDGPTGPGDRPLPPHMR